MSYIVTCLVILLYAVLMFGGLFSRDYIKKVLERGDV